MNAEQMRKVTKQGALNKSKQNQKVLTEAQTARKKMLIQARKQATRELPLVLKRIKAAAKSGLTETTYDASAEHGRWANEVTKEWSAVVDFLKDDLVADGYTVELTTERQEPVGSDPERFDTYYTLDLDISWKS